MIGNSLAHIRYNTTHRHVADSSDNIVVEGVSRPSYVHKVAITPFFLENRGGFVVGEWRHHLMLLVCVCVCVCVHRPIEVQLIVHYN